MIESSRGDVRSGAGGGAQHPTNAAFAAGSMEMATRTPADRNGSAIAVVIRHWRLALVGLVVSIGLAGGAAIYQKPVYESRALLSPGQVGGMPLTSAAKLVAVLKARYGVGLWQSSSASLPKITSVHLDSNSGLISMVAADRTGAGAADFLEHKVHEIMRAQLVRYGEATTLLIKRRTAVEAALHRLSRALPSGSPVPRSGVSRQAPLTTVGWTAEAVASLESQLTDLDIKTSGLQSVPPGISAGPTHPKYPVRPRPKLYLAIGVVGGVIFALFLVAVAERLISNGPPIREEIRGGKGGSSGRAS